jgi:hypothetical protein
VMRMEALPRRRTRVAWGIVVLSAMALVLSEAAFGLELKVPLYSHSTDSFRVVAETAAGGAPPVQRQLPPWQGPTGIRAVIVPLEPGDWRIRAERSPAGQSQWRSWGGRELSIYVLPDHAGRRIEMALDYFPRRRSIVPLVVAMCILFGLLGALAVRADVRQARSEGQRRVNPPPDEPFWWVAGSFLCFPLVILYSAIHARIRDAVPRHPPLSPLQKILRTPPIAQGVLVCLWAPVAGLAIAWGISPVSLAHLRPVIAIAALVVLSASIIVVQRMYEKTVPQTRRARRG